MCRVCLERDSVEVDHVVPASAGGTDDPSNLRGLCVPCHREKSLREAAKGRRRQAGARLLPPERHPGLR
ncbi:HNH endonuclease [Kineococcus rhizosphaerae]|uniref:HNH endonuclease n=1 Tax=Kineococcus rhizosphaerae TaxID=559628 RepID=UPI003CCBED81